MKRSRRRTLRRARTCSHFSFERLEPRLVFAAQLDFGPVPDTVTVSPAQQVGQFSVSSGPELIRKLGPAWSGTFEGQSLYQTVGANISVRSSNFIAVDLTKTYALSGWARSGDEFGLRYDPANLQSFGFASYDKDRLQILPQHVLRFSSATDTTLAVALNPGDTLIHLTNASGWSNSAGASPQTRGLAWYGYQDSTGTTYVDYSYTRNVAMGDANGLWLPGAVNGNVITLSAPWSGPSLPAGTTVRDTGDGRDANYVALDSQPVPDDWTWTQYAAIFGGQVQQSGNDAVSQFRPGTAFVTPIIVSNEQGGTNNFVGWSGVTVTEVAAGTTVADVGPTVVDLSVITGGDQRHAVTPGSPYSTASLVKVDTSQQYSITGRALNMSEHDIHPFGFISFDVDQKLIHALHVTKHPTAADTTLAAALMPGDMSLLISNASGWSNDSWESADTRSLAWYGYTDSTGHTYADYTYTRNVAFDFDNGLWQPGAIHFDAVAGAYRINLIQPWSGPTISAGAAIRNAASSDTMNRVSATPGYDTRRDWVEYYATIGGSQWENGQPNEDLFRPGTRYIEPLFISTLLSGDITVAPIGNVVGSENMAVPADHHVELDFDVLAKNAFSGTVTVAGDYNRDLKVDSSDYVVWRKSAGATGIAPFSSADGNGDGKIDQSDFQVWRQNVGRTTSIVIDSVSTPQHGVASIVAGPSGANVVHYRSNAWFVGTDVVTYTLRNTATNQTITSSITVHVLGGNVEQNPTLVATLAAQAQIAGNLPPKAVDDISGGYGYQTVDGLTLLGDGSHAPTLLANDTDAGNTLVTRLLSGPAHGTLSLNYDGTFAYTPEAGFAGTDSFRYEAFDGQFAESAVAAIKVFGAAEDFTLDKLKNIGLSILNYESSKKRLPITNTASYFDANGNPYLSWRVHVLPYLGYQLLYNQFQLNEPWDSPNNLPLASQMPDIFREPGDAANSTTTQFQIISAEGAPYYWRRSAGLLIGPTYANFTDGASNSLLVVETGADKAVGWTMPDQTTFDPNNPLSALGTLASGKFHAVLADSSTITLSASIDPAIFKNLVTISGGEVENVGTLRRQYFEDYGGASTLQSQQTSITNLRNIAIAMQNYHDTKKSFPIVSSASFFDANGNPYLSWRVHILPFIEENILYNKFHLNEPWDSPNNLPLLAEMPDVFRSVGDLANSTTTRFETFTGPAAPFGFRPAGQRQSGPSIQSITDGQANTIAVAEVGVDKAVFWTKPDDSPFDKNNPLAALGNLSTSAFRAAFFDGHVSTFNSDIAPAIFSALVTRNGGELVDPSVYSVRDSIRNGVPQLTSSASSTTVNNLRQVSIAMLDYESARNIFPIGSSSSAFDPNGMPYLSWRVHILPYMGYSALYSKFHLNEPWDSPNNLPLLDQMPSIYRTASDPWDSVTTRVVEFTGPGAPFLSKTGGNQTGPTIPQITDGMFKTIEAVEAGDGIAVPWTKPSDIEYYANNPYSPLGDVGSNFIAAFFDGHIATLDSATSMSLLKAYITYKGGEDTTNPPTIPNVPGFYISQTAGNTVANEFGADQFDIVLDKAPGTSVVLNLNVSDTNVATLDQATLTFTTTNWNAPQRVIFRAVDNHVINPDQVVNITVSVVAALSDDAYDSVAAKVFTATVRNDDFAAADYDHNGLVEQADYTTWRANYGGTANNTLAADGNGNGAVDAGDYVFWRKKLTAPGAGAAADSLLTVSPPLAATSASATPLAEENAAIDEAFARLASGIENFVNFGERSAEHSPLLFAFTQAGNADARTDLLLVLRGQALPRPQEQSESSTTDSMSQQSTNLEAVSAMELAPDWPSLD